MSITSVPYDTHAIIKNDISSFQNSQFKSELDNPLITHTYTHTPGVDLDF